MRPLPICASPKVSPLNGSMPWKDGDLLAPGIAYARRLDMVQQTALGRVPNFFVKKRHASSFCVQMFEFCNLKKPALSKVRSIPAAHIGRKTRNKPNFLRGICVPSFPHFSKNCPSKK